MANKYRYHQAANIYNAGLKNTLDAYYTNFEVIQGKISAIISDSELKEYQDGKKTWHSKYAATALTVDELTTSFSDFQVTYDQDKAETQSLIAQYRQAVDGYSAELSQVNSKYNQTVTNYNNLTATVSGISTRVGSVESTLENDYSTTEAMETYVAQQANAIELRVKAVYISGVRVEYALGTSSSTAPSSGWSTSTPQWTPGKYIWQRTALTKNGETTYSNTTCIQGAQGPQGPQGAQGSTGPAGQNGSDGVSVTSLTPQYYLSTSRTTQTGGSWQTSPPEYVNGRYYWMRTKINYSNGTVDYSTAVLDTELNNLESRMTTAELKITDSAIISTVTETQSGKAAINSLIDQRAGSITIKANQIELEGLVTANGLFKINTAGSAEIAGGKFAGWTVDSGHFYWLGTEETRSGTSKKIQKSLYFSFYNKDPFNNNAAICIVGDYWTAVTHSGQTYYMPNARRARIGYNGIIYSEGGYNGTDSWSDQNAKYINKAMMDAGVFKVLHNINNATLNSTLAMDYQTISYTGPSASYGATRHTVGISFFSNLNAVTIEGSNGIFAASFNQASDQRLKKNIRSYTKSALDVLSKLHISSYKWNDCERQDVTAGIIAQNLQEVAPELVHGDGTEENYLSIDQAGLVPYLVKAVQELNEKVRTLESKGE